MWKERLLVALLVGSLLPTSVAATASAGGDAPDSLEPPAIGPTTAAEAYGQESGLLLLRPRSGFCNRTT